MTREEAIKIFNTVLFFGKCDCPNEEIKECLKTAIKALEQEPRKGYWLRRPHVYGVTYCSVCDFELKIDNTNYCPNCGADMREVEE